MNPRSVLITGGFGCIGAETAKWLIEHSDARIVVCSRTVSAQRGERVFHGVDPTRLVFVQADVRNQRELSRILDEYQITHVAHLAALQTPDCNAQRDLGLQINLAGTQNMIEAVKGYGRPLQRFVYASSIAVYGPRDAYPEPRVPMLAQPLPVNVYGVWKLAGEHLCRLFCQESGVPTISVRPGVLFGPGRDAGLTSSPTTAMKCVALGAPYTIPFASRQDYLYAPDVGAAFGNMLLEPFSGYGVFTLPSHTVATATIVDLLRQAAIELGVGDRFQITIGEQAVPFICDLDYTACSVAFPNAPRTDLAQAIRRSLQVFLDQAARGWLTAPT